MRHFARVFAALTALLLVQIAASSAASAACGAGTGTCYAIAAGNFNNATTVWSASSGGITCACTPANGDNIVLNASSGSGTYSINVTGYSFNSFDASTFTGTLAFNNPITITGNDAGAILGTALVLPGGSGSAVTNSANNGATFTSTSGTASIKSNGKIFGDITVNGAGGTVQFLDAPSVTTGVNASISVTNGTLNFNGQNATTVALISNNTNTRAINMGSSTLTITGPDNTQTAFNLQTTTGLTCTCSSGTITFTDTSIHPITMHDADVAGTPASFGTVNVPSDSARAFTIGALSGQTMTIGNLNVTFPAILLFNLGATYDITNSFSWSGSSTAPQSLVGGSSFHGGSTVATISSANNGAMSWAIIGNLTFTGGGTFTATSSFDGGGNTGITISRPAGGGGGGIIGGWLLERDLGHANDNAAVGLAPAA